MRNGAIVLLILMGSEQVLGLLRSGLPGGLMIRGTFTAKPSVMNPLIRKQAEEGIASEALELELDEEYMATLGEEERNEYVRQKRELAGIKARIRNRMLDVQEDLVEIEDMPSDEELEKSRTSTTPLFSIATIKDAIDDIPNISFPSTKKYWQLVTLTTMAVIFLVFYCFLLQRTLLLYADVLRWIEKLDRDWLQRSLF